MAVNVKRGQKRPGETEPSTSGCIPKKARIEEEEVGFFGSIKTAYKTIVHYFFGSKMASKEEPEEVEILAEIVKSKPDQEEEVKVVKVVRGHNFGGDKFNPLMRPNAPYFIATKEKRDKEKVSRKPLNIMQQIRDKNVTARQNFSSPSLWKHNKHSIKRLRPPVGHNKTPQTWYREEELRQYKSILEMPQNYDQMVTFMSPTPRSPIFATRPERAIARACLGAEATRGLTKRLQSPKPPLIILDEEQLEPRGQIESGSDADVLEVIERVAPKKSPRARTRRVVPPVAKVNTLESDLALQEVYQKSYLDVLREKYDVRKRDAESLVAEERVRAEYSKEKNDRLAKSLEERLRRHLAITEVAIEDPEPEEEEDLELPELSADMEAGIDSALESHPAKTLVDAYNIAITRKDLDTLRGLNWLNDEVINFYMQMIVERSRDNDNWPTVYATNTFFYPKLMQSGHGALKRWTRKVDIFAHDLMLIPVHLGMHWCLATVDLKKKAVYYYDSMGGDNHKCLQALLKYLEDEHMDKKKATLDTSNYEALVVKDIPQQMNGSDCGMFACKFAEYLSRNAAITFSQEDMPYFRRRMIYEIVNKHLMHP